MSISGLLLLSVLFAEIHARDLIGIVLVVGIAGLFALIVIYGARFKPKKRKGTDADSTVQKAKR